jgi:hypothetical protein
MLICQCNAMRRRDVMCGGGATMFGAIVATLMGNSKPVKPEAISGSVPLITWLYQLPIRCSAWPEACRCRYPTFWLGGWRQQTARQDADQ